MSDLPRTFSKNQVRKLGSRLRNADVPTEEDVSAYIEWSQGFRPALNEVEAQVRDAVRRSCAEGTYELSARIRQISSVKAKLIRQRTSMSDLEDIAGCRAIVPTLPDVERVILDCTKLSITRTRDYRGEDRNGYRTVHLTLRSSDGLAVEFQIRTRIQHAWAQLTERAAAVAGMDVKYGGGPADIREALDSFRRAVRFVDVAKLSQGLRPIFEEIFVEAGEEDSFEDNRKPWREVEARLTEHEEGLISLWATLFIEDGMET